MNKAIFIRKDFNKCSKLDNCFDFPFINLSYFRNCDNFLHPVKSSINYLSILTEYINIAMAVNFFYDYCCTCNTLYFLNYFAARTNQSADQFLGNCKHFYPWRMRLKIRSRFSNGLAHYIQNMQSSGFGLTEGFGKDFN